MRVENCSGVFLPEKCIYEAAGYSSLNNKKEVLQISKFALIKDTISPYYI